MLSTNNPFSSHNAFTMMIFIAQLATERSEKCEVTFKILKLKKNLKNGEDRTQVKLS